jgi:hypothetical protein
MIGVRGQPASNFNISVDQNGRSIMLVQEIQTSVWCGRRRAVLFDFPDLFM